MSRNIRENALHFLLATLHKNVFSILVQYHCKRYNKYEEINLNGDLTSLLRCASKT